MSKLNYEKQGRASQHDRAVRKSALFRKYGKTDLSGNQKPTKAQYAFYTALSEQVGSHKLPPETRSEMSDSITILKSRLEKLSRDR